MKTLGSFPIFIAFIMGILIFGTNAEAQLDAKDRPKNTGLVGGVVLDKDSRPIGGATVDLHRVSGDVSECNLRLYGPGGRMNKSVKTSSSGTFLIAFEWDPEQLSCVMGGAQPQAYVNVLVFNSQNQYQTTAKQAPLLLAPNLPSLFKGGSLKAGGPLGDQFNKTVEEAIKDNPALKSYLKSLSDQMSIEMYGLMGDAGLITAAKP